MFGYCHNDECPFDIWAPNHHHIENRAFSPYVKHTQEIEDIIEEILAAARRGETSFDVEYDDSLSDADLEYIKQEVQRRFI